MKARFSTLDIISILPEINAQLKGLRVNQIYDVDNKTYLIRFKKIDDHGNELEDDGEGSNNKIILVLESGIRFHTTTYQWPKSVTPSGFTMKLRKHLKNKRLEYARQIGVDRIVDFQFGSGPAAYHVILELYDRGNLVITDCDWMILNILRPRQEVGEDSDVKFRVRERYPCHLAKTVDDYEMPTVDQVKQIFEFSKPNDSLRSLFVSTTTFGPTLLDHAFRKFGLTANTKLKSLTPDCAAKVQQALLFADEFMRESGRRINPGFIIKNVTKSVVGTECTEIVEIEYQEYHPHLFAQFANFAKEEETGKSNLPVGKAVFLQQLATFNEAVDLFYSSLKGQKLDHRQKQLEKEALMKLERVRLDHEKRLEELAATQKLDQRKADLILMNSDLIEKALSILRTAVAKRMSWSEIEEQIKKFASEHPTSVASRITSLNLAKGSFSLVLWDPFSVEDESQLQPTDKVEVSLDLDLSSYANARKYHDERKSAATKEVKTVASTSKAYKSAMVKTQAQLKEVAIKTSISKQRKIYWFEKFYWAISSENYLMIAGKDAQQNELIVKRYMKPGDVYVHGDLHGAASVVVKNNYPDQEIPPLTLEEAGAMAICYSSAWDAKIVTRSWWVYPDQVSKTAPAGEYLTVGAFMIRGKKNYLPQTQLTLGFGFVFKVDQESVERHLNERSVRGVVNSTDGHPDDIFPSAEEVESNNSNNNEDEDDEDESVYPDTKLRSLSVAESERSSRSEASDGQITTSEIIEAPGDDEEGHDDDSVDGSDVETNVLPNISPHVNLLTSLTGQPHADDHLLFCLAMVGPYSALSNYKYKVKIMPGSTKRGKVAKNALHIFTVDKSATQREKDLLKSVKDLDISINLPANIKMTAANLSQGMKAVKAEKKKKKGK